MPTQMAGKMSDPTNVTGTSFSAEAALWITKWVK